MEYKLKTLFLWIGILAFYVGFTAAVLEKHIAYLRYVPTITYKVGSTGDGVKALQSALKGLGFYSGEIDGIYGSGTESAVRRFQSSRGLSSDGQAGPNTLSELGLVVDADFENDFELLAAVIYGEGRGEPYEGQVAIGAVILNRVESPLFPNTISEVVYQTGAFDVVEGGQLLLLSNESTRRAALDALGGWDPTNGALYYWNPVTATSQWIWQIPISMTIGNHVFGSPEN
ncbi:MAG: spore cortex-lytic enzyme [Firmicutes bacterium]|nr:spore cortex-lytic enzyme [Bacillota bacterium]